MNPELIFCALAERYFEREKYFEKWSFQDWIEHSAREWCSMDFTQGDNFSEHYNRRKDILFPPDKPTRELDKAPRQKALNDANPHDQ